MHICTVYDYMNMEVTIVSYVLWSFALVTGEGNVGKGVERKGKG